MFKRNRDSDDIAGKVVKWVLLLCALLSVATTMGIVITLLYQAWGFFFEVNLWEFITGTRWSPILKPTSFGVLPLVGGTLLVSLIAAALALPVGLGAAIFLSEYAHDKVRRVVKPVLEVLAGVPTVVYGYFALTWVTPLLQETLFADIGIFNALSAMIVVGIMTVPMVSSISDDSLRAVPSQLREAAYGVGATRFEVITKVAFPAALSGIVASYILAISRAIGETMAVAVAAGATPQLTMNPLESVQTMTSYIVQVAQGEAPHGTIEFKTIFAVALTLFAMTLLMNLLSARVVARFRERYE